MYGIEKVLKSAAYNNDIVKFQKLMAINKVDPEILGEILISATNDGDTNIVIEIGKYLFDVDYIPVLEYRTALFIASDKGFVDIVDFLLEKGANVNKGIGRHKITSLMIACKNGNIDIIDRLLPYSHVNQTDADGESAIFHTLKHINRNNVRAIIDRLLAYGADINLQNKIGYTPIMKRMSNNRLEICKLLLNYGANLMLKSKSEETVLMIGVIRQDIHFVKMLLSFDKNISGLLCNEQNNEGQTPLILAINATKNEIIDILLQFGTDVNIKDKYGRTAIDYAEKNSDVKNKLLMMNTD